MQRRQPAAARLALEPLETRELLTAMPIGMNLEDLVDWSPAWVFTDLFKASRNWTSHSYNTVTRRLDWNGGANVPVSVDEHGWPTELATWFNQLGQRVEQRLGTLMFHGLNGAYPAGMYRAEWDGDGTLFWGNDARVTQTGRTPAGRNFAMLNVTPANGGIYMRIDAINPADPPRNINVWMPDYNGQSFVGEQWQPGADFSPFHPLFLERLRPFQTIRAIHANDTIESDIERWSDRRELSDARQSTALDPYRNGWAPEYQIELCNELEADCWFNMPHMADDDYVRNFATLVRDTLDPDLKAYVEWSNEVWNFAPGFEATFWVRDQTQLPENSGLSHWQIVARETRRDLDIWSQVFAAQSDRIVRVVGGFAAVPWITNEIARHMGDSFDAIAIAPYIGPPQPVRDSYTAATTPDQILDDTRAAIPFMTQRTVEHRQMADRYGRQFGRPVELLAYEGGLHLDGRNQPYQNAMFQAGFSPRIGDLYRDYLTALEGAGVDLFMHFTFTGRAMATQWGDFAALHRMDEPLETALKYRALLDYMEMPEPPAVPTVAIAATDRSAAEAGADPAVFTITRSGTALNEPLTVHLRFSGTARNGVDFETLAGSITIAAGAAEVTVSIVPIDDRLAEGRESVVLAISPNATYTLGAAASAAATIRDDDAARLPVLMVIANRDFCYQEYADTRRELEAAGLRVAVAAATRAPARPHAGVCQGTNPAAVMPDLRIDAARAADYSSILFVGGWGASAYQFAFPGVYANPAYRGNPTMRHAVNQLVNDFVLADKYISAICHGVTVLGWARVNGASPLAGRRVSAYGGGSPTSNIPAATSTRWHIEQNGATMVAARSIGDPTTAADDVLVDGKLITAENHDTARQYGRTIADYLRN